MLGVGERERAVGVRWVEAGDHRVCDLAVVPQAESHGATGEIRAQSQRDEANRMDVEGCTRCPDLIPVDVVPVPPAGVIRFELPGDYLVIGRRPPRLGSL